MRTLVNSGMRRMKSLTDSWQTLYLPRGIIHKDADGHALGVWLVDDLNFIFADCLHKVVGLLPYRVYKPVTNVSYRVAIEIENVLLQIR